MQGSANPLIQLLYHSGRQYIVPVYQRPYSWSVKQCAQLFDDLEGLLRNDRPSHFFGSVVLKYNQCGDFTECVVIDGQQRLTTVSLLLLTLRDLLRHHLRIGIGKLHSVENEFAQTSFGSFSIVFWHD